MLYKFPHKILNPFLRIGAGGAFVSTPTATIESTANFIKVTSDTKFSPAFESAIGIEWNASATLIPYVELGVLHTTSRSDLIQKGFTAFPFVVGIKMPL